MVLTGSRDPRKQPPNQQKKSDVQDPSGNNNQNAPVDHSTTKDAGQMEVNSQVSPPPPILMELGHDDSHPPVYHHPVTVLDKTSPELVGSGSDLDESEEEVRDNSVKVMKKNYDTRLPSWTAEQSDADALRRKERASPSDDGDDEDDRDNKEPFQPEEEEDPYADSSDARPAGKVEMFVPNISKLAEWPKDKKITSEPVTIRCLPWRILVMSRFEPIANNYRQTHGVAQTQCCLGFFIQCYGEATTSSWTCHAKADLVLVPHTKTGKELRKSIEHTFHSKENDWGYVNFTPLKDLMDPEKGFVKNDIIHLQVFVEADPPHGANWDSKKYTGFVGLKNQGATCYMNSLLQALYFTNKFRLAVYEMPTLCDDPQRSVALSLQRVFYDLQHSNDPVGTRKLTRSFGWETMDSFMQHDVQELCRVLLDNVETKMRGSPVADTIPNLFCGKMLSYIRCKNVDWCSQREENFYDIQLKVRGNKNINDAFKDYIAVETLDNDNRYDAGPHGLQDAEKGVFFLQFPPVLYLQLMRFQYDPVTGANVKVNDRFEFPYHLNLEDFLKNRGSSPSRFVLFAVLVHSGDNQGGHYVAYINPRGDGKWYKFDDDVVCQCTPKEAIERNFGGYGEEIGSMGGGHARSSSNAYMLVYISEEAKEDVLVPVQETDIPRTLREQFAAELQAHANKQRELEQAHLYTKVVLLLEEDFEGWQGLFLFDEPLSVRQVQYPRTAPYADFMQVVAESLHLKAENIRLWAFRQKRIQHTSQPRYVLEHVSEAYYASNTFADLWVEVVAHNVPRTPFPSHSPDDCLIFVKYFDIVQQELIYLGHIVAPRKLPLLKILEPFRERLQLKSGVELLCHFETVREGNIVPIRTPSSKFSECLQTAQMSPREDGHVVVIQLPTTTPPPMVSPSAQSGGVQVYTLEDYYSLGHMDILFLSRSCLLDSVATAITQSLTSSPPSSPMLSEGKPSGPLSIGAAPPVSPATHVGQHPLLTAVDVASASELAHKYHAFFLLRLSPHLEYWDLVRKVTQHIQTEFATPGAPPLKADHVQLFTAGPSGDIPLPSTTRKILREFLPLTQQHLLSTGRQLTLILDDRKPPPYLSSPQKRTFIYRLFYQILTKPIQEIESMQALRIWYVGPLLREEVEVNVSVSPNAHVEDLLAAVLLQLQQMQQLMMQQLHATGTTMPPTHPLAMVPKCVQDLRLWEVGQNRLLLEHAHDKPISQVMLSLQVAATMGTRYLRVDHIMEDERNLTSNDLVLRVAHFSKDPNHMHGLPFTLRVSEDEPFSSVAERIRQRVDVSAKEFSKYRIVLMVNNQQLQSITPDENTRVQLRQLQSLSTQQYPATAARIVWIGLDHRSVTRRSVEKAIKIHN